MNLKSITQTKPIPFLSETQNQLLLSNLQSFTVTQNLLNLLNSIIERDLLDIKWKLSSDCHSSVLLEITCYSNSDRLKFLEFPEIKTFLFTNKIVICIFEQILMTRMFWKDIWPNLLN